MLTSRVELGSSKLDSSSSSARNINDSTRTQLNSNSIRIISTPKSDHSVFYRNSQVGIILLVVYVDEIIITGYDMTSISSLKSFLHGQFHTKDLGMLKYFLGVEVMRSKRGIFLSLRKYVLDLLSETEKLATKPC